MRVQTPVTVVKMATVLEEYTTEEQRSVERFQWTKWLNAKDINKEIYLIYAGKCFTRKEVYSLVEKLPSWWQMLR
jgi:hypothetical protein